MDLIRLEAFEALDAIDRYGTFAAAAAALYRVPSAMSYVIGQLEDELGVKVFDRRKRKAVFTPAGRLLLAEGRRILAANREVSAAARRLSDGWEPELRIAIDTLIPRDILWPALRAAARDLPSVRIRLLEETLGGTWEALVEGRADLAIGVDDAPGSARVERLGQIPVEFVYCCAPDHALSQLERPITYADIHAFPAVVIADSARRFATRSASASLLDDQPRLTVGHMSTKLEAIRQGLGVGFCPREWIDDDRQRGELTILELAEPRDPIWTDVLCRQEKRGRALKWFIDQLDLDNY